MVEWSTTFTLKSGYSLCLTTNKNKNSTSSWKLQVRRLFITGASVSTPLCNFSFIFLCCIPIYLYTVISCALLFYAC